VCVVYSCSSATVTVVCAASCSSQCHVCVVYSCSTATVTVVCVMSAIRASVPGTAAFFFWSFYDFSLITSRCVNRICFVVIACVCLFVR